MVVSSVQQSQVFNRTTGLKSQQYKPGNANYMSVDKFENEQSQKVNKKQITGAILGLGIAAVGYLLFKKWNAKPVKQLAQHIDFIKAENINDAIKFAEKNLGVKLSVNGQLKTANWVNESLVNLSNKTKGKILLPKEIKIKKLPKGIGGKYNPFTRTVYLSDASFGKPFERDFDILKKNGGLSDRLLMFNHEVGHGVHLTNSNMLNEIFKTGKFKKIITPHQKELSEYLGGEYYTKCEGEAFAQIFGKKMAGDNLPDFVENIWKQIGGTY